MGWRGTVGHLSLGSLIHLCYYFATLYCFCQLLLMYWEHFYVDSPIHFK
jgi:hypothetical protein